MKNDRVRLLFLIDSLGAGGAEQMLLNLLPHLDTTRLNMRVAVFAIREGNPMARPIQELGVPVDWIPVSRISNPLALPRMVSYLHRFRIELLHTQLVTANILGSIAGWILGIPRLASLHTLDAPSPGSRTEKRRILMWWALRHFCNQVIAVSEKTRQHHMQIGRLPGGKVTTVYNGVDRSRFDAGGKSWRVDIRRQLGLSMDAPLLVTVAVLREPKGIQNMIAAMPDILKRTPSTRYLIVGGGPYEAQLRAQIAESGLEDQVIMTGPREDIPQILTAADLFIHPTLDDALPTVLAEAMAAGKPIVASSVGGVPEMVEQGRNGLLVPPADEDALSTACLSLIEDSEKCRSMSSASLQISAEKFDIRKQASELNQIYQALVDWKRHD